MKEKKPMSLKKACWIAIPSASFCAALVVGITVPCLIFAGVLDTYLGYGTQHISYAGGSNADLKYYKADFADAESASANAKELTKQVAEEGMTLLKNDGALPLLTNKSPTPVSAKKVSLFGRRSVDTFYGGTGSGAGDTKQCITFADAFKEGGYEVNPTLTGLYTSKDGEVEAANNAMDSLSTLTYYIGELPSKYYGSEVTSSYSSYADAAFVVLGRQGGEGLDLSTDLKGSIGNTGMSASVAETANYAVGQHQLELSKEEKDLIAHVESHFSKVVVLIDSANPMEIGTLQNDAKINAIVWTSLAGSTGLSGLANLLNGTVCFSGRTVDTWSRDFTLDPAFNNNQSLSYLNVNSQNAAGTFYGLDYEEGIYVGYRYYETRYAGDEASYRNAVVYPFGYGLSYSSFNASIIGTPSLDEKNNCTVKVSVQNTGTYAGKEVVQLYGHAPYTQRGIEKAERTLVAFEKTDTIAPGASAELALSFNLEDMASYDAVNAKAYVLEQGDYLFTLQENSHEAYPGSSVSWTKNIPSTIVYNAANPRQREKDAQAGDRRNLSLSAKSVLSVASATNAFDETSSHFVSAGAATSGEAVNLSRADFSGSFPEKPNDARRTASADLIAKLQTYQPDYYQASDVAPTTGKSAGETIATLRGKTYDDPVWESFLDQLTVPEMVKLIYTGNQGTTNLASIGLPASSATDGPSGLKQFGTNKVAGNFYTCEALLAATFNSSLAKKVGNSVGNEALIAGKNGWYAPGADLHRSPFGGRNFEYFSEDPLLSGKMCAAEVAGCEEKGLTTYIKHFALNESETHRVDNGVLTWANEQAIRELYLRAFEIAVEEPTASIAYLDGAGESQSVNVRSTVALMSSFSRIGSTWCGASASLLQNVLRKEWGFLGTVITDYNGQLYMNVESGVVAGNDLMLANASTLQTKFKDTSKASTQLAIRQATKNILYSLAYSNLMNGLNYGAIVTYDISPWRLGLIAADVALGAAALSLVTWVVLKANHDKKDRLKNKTAGEGNEKA